jgi:hypothetical protein
MFSKILIIIVMLVILGALASGLFFLVRDRGKSNRTLKALTLRIGFSLGVFVFLWVAFYFHWLTPHGI